MPAKAPGRPQIDDGKHRWQQTRAIKLSSYTTWRASLPRYVAAQRQGESAWRMTWENRDKRPGKLATWFCKLAAEGREPAERVVLGRGVGLTEKTAFTLARFRVAEICRAATGDPEQMADFVP